jgi:hypothetical protein
MCSLREAKTLVSQGPGGVPLHDEKNKAQEVLVTDPDGFFVSLAQQTMTSTGASYRSAS